ncbi:MAG: hypothetical protein CMD81_14640 [Gammaproteobacteria bacterium]|nr:hypothetical protein [Gammaproteobacteria bacterium]HBF08999.1 hypothetical protein [Gammaproteobacteria bacterium]|tara:strand:- start:10978 stop:12810 length:1833 start_codon:yes stop_codon:yes gene_type:complete
MAYEYGSTDLGIKNPFKIEGSIRATRGGILALLGVYALFTVKGLVESGQHLSGWFALGVGVLLLVHGMTVASFGIMQVTRFFVGRGVPTSLAKNRAKSEAHRAETDIVYSAQDLEQMLQGRKNITISEPEGWFARLVHSIFPRLIFLPYAYRNIAQQLGQALAQSLFGLLCFSLAWFSGASGLTSIDDTNVLQWLALGLAVYFIYVWARCGKPLSRNLQKEPDAIGIPTIAAWIAFSILLPFVLLAFDTYIFELPKLHFDTSHYMMIILVFAGVTSIFSFILLRERASLADPKTEVSEMRNNWQESIHPQEIFINFENIVMANRRYKEVPNRLYRDYNADLDEGGSDDKGQFTGETIQETQPVYKSLGWSKMFLQVRYLTTLIGHFALLWAAVSLYQNMGEFVDLLRPLSAKMFLEQLYTCIGLGFFVTILWVFGSILSKLAHAFWSEMCFESLVVFFQCQGTFTESRLSTGTSIYDSLRSENVLVRSSMTPWILVSRLVTSCFTATGEKNLEHPRHILEMHSANHELDKIIHEMRGFLDNRETIASIKNMKDLHSTANIQQVNTASRVPPAHHAAMEAEFEENIDEERAIEYSGFQISSDKNRDEPERN